MRGSLECSYELRGCEWELERRKARLNAPGLCYCRACSWMGDYEVDAAGLKAAATAVSTILRIFASVSMSFAVFAQRVSSSPMT